MPNFVFVFFVIPKKVLYVKNKSKYIYSIKIQSTNTSVMSKVFLFKIVAFLLCLKNKLRIDLNLLSNIYSLCTSDLVEISKHELPLSSCELFFSSKKSHLLVNTKYICDPF